MLNCNFISPFYTPDALAVASKYFPFIKNNIDEGSLPVIVGRRYLFFQTIELVGNQYADYRSVVCPEVNLGKILNLHLYSFKKHIIELGGICEFDSCGNAITNWIDSGNLVVYKKKMCGSPYLRIDCSWEEFKNKKKKKFWYNISRAYKLLEDRHGLLSFKIIDNADQIPEILDRCMTLYKENWNKFTSSSLFITEKGRSFLNDFLLCFSNKGNAEVCILEQNGKLLAFSIGLKIDSTYYFYLFATTKEDIYSNYSVGKIHIRYLLESVFNRRFRIFDFMAGEEPYKYEWTKDSQSRATYYVMSKNIVNTLMVSVFKLFDMLVTYLKRQKVVRDILRRVPLLKK